MKLIESQIRNRIQERFARGIRIFYVMSFIDICTSNQVEEVLMGLAAKGELEARANVHCPNNHLCWGSRLEQALALKPFRCSECEEEIEDPQEASTLYFAIPAHIKSQDELSLARAEIVRLRAALEQIANQTDLRTKGLMKSAPAIAREALK